MMRRAGYITCRGDEKCLQHFREKLKAKDHSGDPA
jgi:hypothetical protein